MTDERSDMQGEPMNEREQRVEAALALTSTAPASLWERIRARRAAGERVILPVPRGTPAFRRRGVPALALSLAAAAVVTVFAVQAWRAGPDGGAKRGRGPGADTAAVLYTATVDTRRPFASDSVIAIATADADRLVEIAYAGEGVAVATESRRVADSLAGEFHLRGLPAEAVRVRQLSGTEQIRAPLRPNELRVRVFRDSAARGRD